jgi:ribokinase
VSAADRGVANQEAERQPRIAVAGSSNMDLVVTAPVLPRPGETVLGDRFTQLPGGKGANQAIAASRAGGRTTFLGAIGSDAFGVTLKARLSSSTVDTSLLRVVYGASGVALIVVEVTGQNAIVVAPGANAAFAGLTEPELAAVAAADVLLCQLEIPMETVTAACVAGRAAGTRVVLNAAPARALPDELLAAVDLLVVNEVEAATLAPVTSVGVDAGDEPEPVEVLDALLESVPRVVLTQGGAGAWYADRDGAMEQVPAPRVDVVDTTAAGDAFCGALAVAWGEGRQMVDAIRWASAAGAAAVRRLGASNALPKRKVIEELYEETYGRR